MTVHPLFDDARAILAANDRGGYTVPTAQLYPFQWNWDSAFVAMGFATYDPARAYRELERLAEGQWQNGMIPHIVFHAPSDTYFPGPEVWGTQHAIATSGITQPPVFATALRAVHIAAAAKDPAGAEARSRPLFEAALAWHRWWLSARDPDATGLVALLHPWESGSDNSPAWDDALARVPTDTVTEIRRKDTGHVDAKMRPHDDEYRRFIHLVDTYRATGWRPAEQWRVAPFKVAEVQTTAILLRASRDLLELSATLGTDDESAEIAAMIGRLEAGLTSQWRPELKRFVSRDLITGRDIDVPTQAGFVPVTALDLSSEQRTAIDEELRRWCDGLLAGLPSTPRSDPRFEAKRYWRGPVWAVINWLVIDGLERNGLHDTAALLRARTVAAVEKEGFAEYFDPVTGEGCGGLGFSWTAAAYLVLAGPRPSA